MSKHTEKAIETAVEMFVENGGEPVKARDVAERMGVSPQVAGRALNDSFNHDHGWRRVNPSTAYEECPNRDYPMLGGKMRKVEVWSVTARHLVSLILAARAPKENR